MRKHLTAAMVAKLKAPARGQVSYFDAGYPGLEFRISYGGARTWRVVLRVRGRLTVYTLGTFPAMGLAEAHEAWRKVRADVAAGRDPRPKTTKPATVFDAVFEDWLKRDQAKNRSAAVTAKKMRKDVVPFLTGRDIADIDRRDCLNVVDAIVDRGAIIQARRIQAHLRRLFAWAMGRGIVTVNPLDGVDMPGEARSRERVLSNDELVKIWNAADKIGLHRGAAVKMLILTAARRAEIGLLHRNEIVDEVIDPDHSDRTARCISLSGERTKNGLPHLIPLSAPALALLDSLPQVGDDGWVFTTRRGPLKNWHEVKRDIDALVDIPPWVLHDTRRSIATGLQRMNVPIHVVEALLGHSGGSRGGIVAVYQKHTYIMERAAALEAWGAKVMGLVEGRKGADVVPLNVRAM
jgi:integrase